LPFKLIFFCKMCTLNMEVTGEPQNKPTLLASHY
jgi:hypothetical protein